MGTHQELADQHLRERVQLLRKLVGKDICVQLPNHPGKRRMMHAYSVFGYSPSVGLVRDLTTFDASRGQQMAVGLVVTMFAENGLPARVEHGQHLTVFGYDGRACAHVVPIDYGAEA